MSLQAVLLAAGEGKRMRPLTENRPKVMLPAGGEPILGRLVRQLAAAGVTDLTLVVHHRKEAVRSFFGDGSVFGARIRYEEQPQPRGTGDAVARAGVDGPALVLNGDLFLEDDAIPRVIEAGPGTVAAHRVDDARAYGVLETKDGQAVGVVEKSEDPPTDLANAGLYYLPEGFGKHLADLRPSPRGELEITDALDASFRSHGPYNVVELARWLDVGRPWDLLRAAKRALRGLEARVEGEVEAGATLKGPVHVAEGAVVKAGAYVEGPVWIGPDCRVGPNCHLRPDTVLGRGSKVGNASEVKGSVLLDGVSVGHLSYVGDSVIGAHANLGAGTLVANLRHDGANVHVTTQGARVDSGLRKLGVILGDGVHTGINTSLNAGVVLPAGATTLPGEVVLKSRF